MSSVPLLVLGTANRKKAQELVDLLAPLGLHIRTFAEYAHAIKIEETGDSFTANATLKAVGQARVLNAWVLGEDSGLVVDALQGRPGIYSARYAGPQATDQQNNVRLQAELAGIQPERRTAHYVCEIVLSDPSGMVRAGAGGRCSGTIRVEPRGIAGFGYDPLFEIVEFHRTFAELGETVKSVLSHRARAVEKLVPRLVELRDSGEWT